MFRKRGDTYNQIRDAHTSATRRPTPKQVPLQRVPVVASSGKAPPPTLVRTVLPKGGVKG